SASARELKVPATVLMRPTRSGAPRLSASAQAAFPGLSESQTRLRIFCCTTAADSNTKSRSAVTRRGVRGRQYQTAAHASRGELASRLYGVTFAVKTSSIARPMLQPGEAASCRRLSVQTGYETPP